MVAALAGDVETVVSIELGEELHRKASERFARRQNVKLLRGDSAQLLPAVAAEAPDETLFWLDAHYSHGNTARGAVDTPVLTELDVVLARGRRGDVVLVDDAGLKDSHSTNPLSPPWRRYRAYQSKSIASVPTAPATPPRTSAPKGVMQLACSLWPR